MFDFIHKISNSKRSIFIIVLVLCIAITFETFQQLYYIKRFSDIEGITFFDVLKNQAYKWMVWVFISSVLVLYIKNKASKLISSIELLKLVLVIFGLVFLNILIISISQWYSSGDDFLLSIFIKEYFQFFTYQKSPIYSLGYIAMSTILYLYFVNEKLQIEVLQLSELKLTNAQLYKKLSTEIDDKASILNIKIGNKRKIIPVKTISWIEADDYCVKVHTINNDNYTMRSSLKSLEEKLGSNFIRVHRKAIVNMSLVKELHLSSSPNLILQNDTQIPISKSNLKTVRDFLN